MQITKKAFTLIELVIVVAIISISYSLVLPKIQKASSNSIKLTNLKESLNRFDFVNSAVIVCLEERGECQVYLDGVVQTQKFSLFNDNIEVYKIGRDSELIRVDFADMSIDGFKKEVVFRFEINKSISEEVAISSHDNFIYYSPISISPKIFDSQAEFISYNESKKELVKEAANAL